MSVFIEKNVARDMLDGSFETRIDNIIEAVEKEIGGSVSVVATRSKDAIVVDGGDKFYKVDYVYRGGKIKDLSVKEHNVPIVESLDAYVAKEARSIVRSISEGHEDDDLRNRLRELSLMVSPDKEYWVSNILENIDENLDEIWMDFYKSSREEIKKGLKGSVRKISSSVPRTKYFSLNEGELGLVEDELRDSIRVLSQIYKTIVDQSEKIVFDSKDEEFDAIGNSLSGEAKVIGDLLVDADRLMLSEDLKKMAETHDALAKRVKSMVLVSEYLNKLGTLNEGDGK